MHEYHMVHKRKLVKKYKSKQTGKRLYGKCIYKNKESFYRQSLQLL